MSAGGDSALVRKGFSGRPLIGRLAVAGTLLVAGVALVTVALQDPAQSDLFPPCPIRWATGLECAGCGTLRCIHQLLRGHPVAASHHNPMTIAVLLGLALLGLRALLRRLPGRSGRIERRPCHASKGGQGGSVRTAALGRLAACLHRRRSWIVLAVILSWWIGRNLY